MIKDRYLNTDLYIVEGDLKSVRLLQSKLAKLSTFICNEGAIKSMTNCSFFSSFVLGRNQGDEKNDTYADSENLKYVDVVIFSNGDYRYGYMNNYDFRDNVVCGFSAGAILISEGQDCELYSTPITDIVNIIKTKSPRTAFAITKDNKAIQFVSEGRNSNDVGLTGFEVREYLKSRYDIEMLAILDGGGSTELIENGNIINYLSDGNERSMLNGLAFIDTSFKARTSTITPSDMNKSPYYNNPLYVGKNNYYIGNSNYQCVAYANSRSCEIAGKPITYWSGTSEKKDIENPLFNRYGFGDAKNWIKETNWSHGTEPKLGAIMVYGSDYGNGLGHVRIVEKIEGDKIYYSGANENKQMAFSKISKPKITSKGFLGYIYNPYLELVEGPKEVEKPKEDTLEKAKISQLEEEIKTLTNKLFDMEKQRNEAFLKVEQYKNKEDKIRGILDE